jgi:transcriptional regulator with XRE-family HTH domain
MTRRLPAPAEHSPKVTSALKLGELVRSARGRAQMRIDDAAAVSGVSVDLLSRLERGRPVTSDKLLAVLSSLGLSVLVVDQVQASRIERILTENQPPQHG